MLGLRDWPGEDDWANATVAFRSALGVRLGAFSEADAAFQYSNAEVEQSANAIALPIGSVEREGLENVGRRQLYHGMGKKMTAPSHYRLDW